MPKSPSMPSLAAASVISDGSTVFSASSSNSRDNSYQGSTCTPQSQQTFVQYNFPANNKAFYGSNAEADETTIASTTSSTNTTPSIDSYIKQSQSLKLLSLTGTTEDEILKNAYAALHRSLWK
mmetsp:Transcript_2750/g.3150  ORF Transcript_2750/g.3150 Transcript_2750/m.3150 type:complete len:123 (+) Transcript_2750:269-637(+)